MIAIVVMLVGIEFVAILTAAAADGFMRACRADERHISEQLDEVLARLDGIERSK